MDGGEARIFHASNGFSGTTREPRECDLRATALNKFHVNNFAITQLRKGGFRT